MTKYSYKGGVAVFEYGRETLVELVICLKILVAFGSFEPFHLVSGCVMSAPSLYRGSTL